MTTLADWMRDNGERDETVAKKAKVTRETISRIRRKKQRPSLETARELERLTGIPAADLIFVEIAA